jgi:hypothetical protein
VGLSLRSPKHHSKGVIGLTVEARALAYTRSHMEWMLQVLDEVDDAIGAARLCCVGLAAETGLVVAGGLGIGAIGAALATGAEVSLICSAAIVLALAVALKFHESQLQPGGKPLPGDPSPS